MKRFTNVLKGLFLSSAALITAFLAIALPFRLIGSVEQTQLRALFLAEALIYFVAAMLFLVVKEKKQQRKAAEKEKRLERRAKFEQAQREYYDLAA